MAKKAEVNKSEMIRELITANPKITANEAVDAMKSKGHEITPSLFYAVKQKMGGAKKTPKASAPAAAPTNGTVSISALAAVKNAAEKCGGMEALIEVAKALK